jgi:hypothetical protein
VLRLARNTLSGTLPPGWGRPEVFSWLELLDLSHNALAGALHRPAPDPAAAAAWVVGPFPAAAMYCDHALASAAAAACAAVLGPATLLGAATAAGAPISACAAVLPMNLLLLPSCLLPAGPLPSQWSFQNLRNLSLSHNQLTAAIPPSWGYRTTFPDLQNL